MWKLSILIFCLLLEPIISRRSGGFGGFGGRGSSGARVNSGGSSGGSFSSGGRVGGASSGVGGYNNQAKSGFGGGAGGLGGYQSRGFSSYGSGMGSAARGSAFKSALAGAAIGGLTGIAVGGLIAHATSPFSWGGHNYYWGPEYYPRRDGEFMCTMPLNDLIKNIPVTTTTAAPDGNSTTVSNPDNVLQNLHFPNGSKPHSVVWSCKTNSEVCCGTDCCPNPQASSSTGGRIAGIIIGILLLILLISCCCCFLAYKLCREAFDRFLPTRSQHYENKHDDYNAPHQSYPQSGGYPNQSYPMQPYPSQSQPSYGYPAQQQSYTPNVYPPYPHEQKY